MSPSNCLIYDILICIPSYKILLNRLRIFIDLAEKGRHLAHSVADSLSSHVTEEDIREAEEKVKELEREEEAHLEKETAIYERKARATTPDSIDLLHEEQMDEHEVRVDIFKRKQRAVERLEYLRKKRAEQQFAEN